MKILANIHRFEFKVSFKVSNSTAKSFYDKTEISKSENMSKVQKLYVKISQRKFWRYKITQQWRESKQKAITKNRYERKIKKNASGKLKMELNNKFIYSNHKMKNFVITLNGFVSSCAISYPHAVANFIQLIGARAGGRIIQWWVDCRTVWHN